MIMEQYHVRSFDKPGITSLAQTSGFHGEFKDEHDVVHSAKLDIKYIENWSLPLDLLIICRSLLQIIKPPKSAY